MDVGLVLGFAFVATIVTQIIVGALVSTVLSVAVSAITAKSQKKQQQQATPDAYDPIQTQIDGAGEMPAIFGFRRVGGQIIFRAKKDGVTHVIYLIAGHAVSGIQGMALKNQLVNIDEQGRVTDTPWRSGIPSGGSYYSVTVAFYDGTQTEAVANLKEKFPDAWTSQHIGTGCAFAYVQWNPNPQEVFQSAYENGVPEIGFDVLGAPCYDPREPSHDIDDPDTWEWSANATIVRANFLMHRLGPQYKSADIDWTNVAANADVDDLLYTKADGSTERLYEIHAAFTSSRWEDVLEEMNASCAGGAAPGPGGWQFWSGHYDAPYETIITPKEYLGDGLQFSDYVPIEATCNGVRGTFISPSDKWEEKDFPAYQSATALEEDGDREQWIDVTYRYVTSHTQAQRLAKIAFMRSRHGIAASVEMRIDHFDISSGSVISITHDMAGFAEKTFRVEGDEIVFTPDGEVSMKLTLTHERQDFFFFDPGADEKPFLTLSGSINSTALLTTPSWTLDLATIGATTYITVEIAGSNSANVTGYEIEYKLSASSTWIAWPAVVATGGTIAQNIALGAGDHDVRVRTARGAERSAWSEATINATSGTTTGIAATPATPRKVGNYITSAGVWAIVVDDILDEEAVDVQLLKGTTTDPSLSSQVAIRDLTNPGEEPNQTVFPGTDLAWVPDDPDEAVMVGETVYFWARARRSGGAWSPYSRGISVSRNAVGATSSTVLP